VLKVIEVMPRHFVILLDAETEKQLREVANKRGLAATQTLRMLVGAGLEVAYQSSKVSFDNDKERNTPQ